MSTWNSLLKLYGNIIRNRNFIFHEVFLPQLSKHRRQIETVSKGVREKLLKSEIGRRLEVGYIYMRAECGPPKLSEIQEFKKSLHDLKDYVFKMQWKNMTVRELWLIILVTVEVGMWFFIGEVIGKMHIVGYVV